MRIICTFAAILCSACAVHQPVLPNWRLVRNGTGQVLIPPGIASPDLARRTFVADVAPGHGVCPPNIRRKKKRVLVTVNRDGLLKSPPGWLTTWAAGLESQGCIAEGEGPKLAARIAESLPLDPDVAFHLLYPNDIVPPVRLQVVSPVLRDGEALDARLIDTSGNGNSLNITLKSSDNLIGYETALYAVRPKASGIGFNIVPLYAERHIQQATERRAQPDTNYFQFAPDAAFYRLFVKSGQTDFTALAIAAPTRVELDRLASMLDGGAASCESLTRAKCIAIPRRVAVNSVIPITVNGAEVFVRWGADLGEAIRNTGIRQPETILTRLAVSRLYNGLPAPVEFDRSSPAILRLILTGGEIVSWTSQ